MRAPTRLAFAASTIATLAAATGCQPNPIDLSDRLISTAALQSFETCAELETDLKTSLREEMRTQLLMAEQQQLSWGYGGVGVPIAEDGAAVPSADANESAGSTRTEGQDFSGTNNQESGVDEADFVKTDGYFIYVLNGRRLEVMSVPEFGQIEHVSTLTIEGYPSQMLLDGDKLAVFSYVYTYELPEGDPLRELVGGETDEWGWYWRGASLTKMTVIGLGEDRTSPTVLREAYIEGWLQTGREVEGTVRLITYGWMDLPGLAYWPEFEDGGQAYWNLPPGPQRAELLRNATEATIAKNDLLIATYSIENFVPRMYERTAGGVSMLPFTEAGCANFARSDDGASRGVTSVITLDLDSASLAFEADHIVTNWSTIYASEDVLVVAEPAWDWWWYWGMDHIDEATNIHRFDISEAGKTVYTGSGRVEGTILGQFGLDERDGVLRVASTTGRWNRWWLPFEQQPPSKNHLFLLEGGDADGSPIKEVGAVRDIAEGERIWSSRFTDDTAYLVTFQNIDPLWVIDVKDPAHPRILSELEVPGVSTYIHPLDGGRLLTIGFAGDDEGLFWGQTQVSLFDVSEPHLPSLKDTLGLAPLDDMDPNDGWETWAYSEATYEHKAFQYWGPERLLAVPLSTFRYDYEDGDYEYVSKLKLIDVGEGTLSTYGDIDHSMLFNNEEGYWWDNRDVRRSIFMGEYIYAVSDRGVTVHRIEDLQLMTTVELPGWAEDGGYGYYY